MLIVMDGKSKIMRKQRNKADANQDLGFRHSLWNGGDIVSRPVPLPLPPLPPLTFPRLLPPLPLPPPRVTFPEEAEFAVLRSPSMLVVVVVEVEETVVVVEVGCGSIFSLQF